MSLNQKRVLEEFDEQGYELDNTPPEEVIIKPSIKKKKSAKAKFEYIQVPDLEFTTYEKATDFCAANRLGYA